MTACPHSKWIMVEMTTWNMYHHGNGDHLTFIYRRQNHETDTQYWISLLMLYFVSFFLKFDKIQFKMNYKNLVHMDQTPIGQTETSANNHQGLVRSCPSLGGPTKKIPRWTVGGLGGLFLNLIYLWMDISFSVKRLSFIGFADSRSTWKKTKNLKSEDDDSLMKWPSVESTKCLFIFLWFLTPLWNSPMVIFKYAHTALHHEYVFIWSLSKTSWPKILVWAKSYKMLEIQGIQKVVCSHGNSYIWILHVKNHMCPRKSSCITFQNKTHQ